MSRGIGRDTPSRIAAMEELLRNVGCFVRSGYIMRELGFAHSTLYHLLRKYGKALYSITADDSGGLAVVQEEGESMLRSNMVAVNLGSGLVFVGTPDSASCRYKEFRYVDVLEGLAAYIANAVDEYVVSSPGKTTAIQLHKIVSPTGAVKRNLLLRLREFTKSVTDIYHSAVENLVIYLLTLLMVDGYGFGRAVYIPRWRPTYVLYVNRDAWPDAYKRILADAAAGRVVHTIIMSRAVKGVAKRDGRKRKITVFDVSHAYIDAELLNLDEEA